MKNVRFRVYKRFRGMLQGFTTAQPELNWKVVCKANLRAYCTDASGHKFSFDMWVLNPSSDTGEFDRLLDDIKAKSREIMESSDDFGDIVCKVKDKVVFNKVNYIVGMR